MIVNGKEMNFKDGITVTELLREIKLDEDKVVVEVDFQIINKNEYNRKKLSTTSKVELIRFVGGG